MHDDAGRPRGIDPTKSMPRRKSSDRQAADWLRDAIVDGGYTPGARLTENALAEGTELSRSTMRTALLHLASEGLVVREAYSGWRVAELSAADARDVYNLRSALDGLAARHAALNVTDDGVVALKAALLDLVLAARERTDVRSSRTWTWLSIVRWYGCPATRDSRASMTDSKAWSFGTFVQPISWPPPKR